MLDPPQTSSHSVQGKGTLPNHMLPTFPFAGIAAVLLARSMKFSCNQVGKYPALGGKESSTQMSASKRLEVMYGNIRLQDVKARCSACNTDLTTIIKSLTMVKYFYMNKNKNAFSSMSFLLLNNPAGTSSL